MIKIINLIVFKLLIHKISYLAINNMECDIKIILGMEECKVKVNTIRFIIITGMITMNKSNIMKTIMLRG